MLVVRRLPSKTIVMVQPSSHNSQNGLVDTESTITLRRGPTQLDINCLGWLDRLVNDWMSSQVDSAVLLTTTPIIGGDVPEMYKSLRKVVRVELSPLRISFEVH